MQAMSDERLWLQWLVKVRIIVLTFLLGIELAITQFTPTPLPMRAFVSSILPWYTISVFYLLRRPFWRENRVQAALQVSTDLVLATRLIQVAGGVESSLTFHYTLIVSVACILVLGVSAYRT